jgi:hypothetical protein
MKNAEGSVAAVPLFHGFTVSRSNFATARCRSSNVKKGVKP